MKLILATGNLDKIEEIRALLFNLDLELIPINHWPDYLPPPETGETLEENAKLKALAAVQFAGLPALADDTGLEVDALGGQPGVHSARFAGDEATYADNRHLLLSRMRNLPPAKRNAAFRTVVALCLPNGETKIAHGECLGVITNEERGSGGFGYDPLFYVPSAEKTFAQMTAEEKNSLSHRGKALNNARALIQHLMPDVRGIPG